MELGIKGKKALVCASSRGLGRGIAQSLAREGVELYLCSSNPVRLTEAAEEMKRLGSPVVHHSMVDLTQHSSRQKLIQDVLKAFPQGVDILIHNVGGPPTTTVESTTLTMWHEALDRLLVSCAHLNHVFLPAMKKRQWGRIITISSLAALEPIPGMALSNGVRAAVIAMNKTLSREIAPFNITVNQVAPGFIHTDRIDQLIEKEIRQTGETRIEALERYESHIPVLRLGTPEEFGDIVTFLCSQQAAYITGETLIVDGGKRFSAF